VRHWVFLVGLNLLAAGRVIDFDALPPGAMPPGWTVPRSDPGPTAQWEIRKDETAPTQPYVLAGNQFPLAILDGVMFRDGDLSVRIKPVAGQASGLVWRYADPRNYYLVRANAADQTVSVLRVQNGQPAAVLASVKYDISPNAWSILKISARGPRFQVYVDHRRVLEGHDGAFTAAGKVGLATIAESYFDDFRVNPR